VFRRLVVYLEIPLHPFDRSALGDVRLSCLFSTLTFRDRLANTYHSVTPLFQYSEVILDCLTLLLVCEHLDFSVGKCIAFETDDNSLGLIMLFAVLRRAAPRFPGIRPCECNIAFQMSLTLECGRLQVGLRHSRHNHRWLGIRFARGVDIYPQKRAA
jgi:hypothetical protein